jgi:carbohydrate kinase (thermoresistant glucokinase family)
MSGREVIVIMGVSGTGKSFIGRTLGRDMRIPFLDADDFHPQENISKMKSGHSLNDDDRFPWLDSIRMEMSKMESDKIVLACSALKESYRQALEDKNYKLNFIVLQASYETIFNRMENRNHFMPSKLLRSQFDTLEIPEYGLHISAELKRSVLLKKIKTYLNRS